MKIERLKERLQADRPTTLVSIRIPNDVSEDLENVASMLGLSNYESLIKAYIGQGLRADLDRLEGSKEILFTK